jgi:hypothetical protein
VKCHPQARTPLLNQLLVAIRLNPSQSVVEMSNLDFNAARGGGLVQHLQESHGVRSAGNCHQHPIAWSQHSPLPEGRLHASGKL